MRNDMRSVRLCVLATCLLASACGGSGGGDGGADLGARLCERRQTCYPTAFDLEFESISACARSFNEDVDGLAGLQGEDCREALVAETECRLESESCTDTFDLLGPEECSDVIERAQVACDFDSDEE